MSKYKRPNLHSPDDDRSASSWEEAADKERARNEATARAKKVKLWLTLSAGTVEHVDVVALDMNISRTAALAMLVSLGLRQFGGN